MAGTKKATDSIELDVRVEKIIREVYDDYKIYLPTPQDRAMFDRKQKEYWDTIRVRLREGLVDARVMDTAEAIKEAE